MEDISKGLLDTIKKEYAEALEKSPGIKGIVKKIEKGTATQSDCQLYSKALGILLGKVLQNNIVFDALPNNTLYWNIAEAILPEMYEMNHTLVMTTSKEIQKLIDRGNNISLNAKTPKINRDKVHGIMENVTEEGIDQTQLSLRLEQNTMTFTQSMYDDFVRTNAETRDNMGVNAIVHRVSNGPCCKWCDDLAGDYNYEEVKETGHDVWRRHSNCTCQITVEFIKVQPFGRNGKRLNKRTQ